ncbi:MAG: YjgN family protein, partial [Gammaproteobacteria bacterium]
MTIDIMADNATTAADGFITPMASESARAGEERTKAEFTGTAAQYFRIWMVNMLLTIITVGFYSPWAKVRNKRYFYGSAWLSGANFEYHAKPLAILVARLVLLAMFVAIPYGVSMGDFHNIGYFLILAVFLPWALVRGLAFNARNSSFAGMRFSFKCDFVPIYLIYSPVLIFSGLFFDAFLPDGFLLDFHWTKIGKNIWAVCTLLFLLSLPLPLLVRAYHSYKAGRHKLGGLRFYLHKPPVSGYYGALIVPLLCAMGIVVLVVGLMLFIAFKLGFDKPGGGITGYIGFINISTVLLSAVVFVQFSRAALLRLFWGNLRARNDKFEGRFVCDINILHFAFLILLVNVAAVIMSLGLLHPWAKIRKTKYLVQHIHIIAPTGAMSSLAAREGKKELPLGEELEVAEGFDFDVGLI